MKEFKGLKVPDCEPMKEFPKAKDSCHAGGSEYCAGLSCGSCVFSKFNPIIRLEYYNYLKNNEMKFDEKENVLRVGGKVYDVVERKLPSLKKGYWYKVSNPNRISDEFSISRLYEVNNEGLFVADMTISTDGSLSSDTLNPISLYSKCSFTKATQEDFLHFDYRLLKTKQPWDGEMQEFLLKDKALIIYNTSSDNTLISIGFYQAKTEDRLKTEQAKILDRTLIMPATQSNIEKMTEWMKFNLG